MAPAKLIVKNSNGTLEPFEVDGVEWIDGSVQVSTPCIRCSYIYVILFRVELALITFY